MPRKLILLASISFILVFISGLNAAEAAFGVSPPVVNADKLVAGSRYSQKIYLVRDIADSDLSVRADLDIAERVRGWINIEGGSEFVIPAGTRQFPITVTITAPKNAENVDYKGKLTFVSSPAGSGGQITIALGAQVTVNLKVGNDIFHQWSIPIVKPLDIEEGWNPRVFVKFQNDGNVPESLDAATFQLFDRFGGATLAYAQKAENFPEAPPFTVKEYVVEFPIDFHLGLGQYWGSVALYKDDKVVATQKAAFQVLERGSLSTLTERVLRNLKNNWPYYAGGVAVLVFVIVFSLIRRHRKT